MVSRPDMMLSSVDMPLNSGSHCDVSLVIARMRPFRSKHDRAFAFDHEFGRAVKTAVAQFRVQCCNGLFDYFAHHYVLN